MNEDVVFTTAYKFELILDNTYQENMTVFAFVEHIYTQKNLLLQTLAAHSPGRTRIPVH